MSRHYSATLHTYLFGEDERKSFDCRVFITPGQRLLIRYGEGFEDGDETCVVYKGQECGDGHYRLKSRFPEGQVNLHRFPDSLIFEGYWEEGGKEGMWRMELGEDLDERHSEAGEALADVVGVGDMDEEEVEEDWGASVPRLFNFPLRDGWMIPLRLPDDLTRKEGKRLAQFVRAIPCGY